MYSKKKRLAIARDVIKQIKMGGLNVLTGQYITGTIPDLDTTEELQCHVDKVQYYCNVCAKGALILSQARLFNNLKIKDILHKPLYYKDYYRVLDYNMERILSEVFGTDTANSMEQAFELWGEFVDLKEKYPIDSDRLLAIMQNYVKYERAEFKPEEL